MLKLKSEHQEDLTGETKYPQPLACVVSWASVKTIWELFWHIPNNRGPRSLHGKQTWGVPRVSHVPGRLLLDALACRVVVLDRSMWVGSHSVLGNHLLLGECQLVSAVSCCRDTKVLGLVLRKELTHQL